MTQKDFATMPIEELEAYCEELRVKLDTARWFLRNRRMKVASDSQITKPESSRK